MKYSSNMISSTCVVVIILYISLFFFYLSVSYNAYVPDDEIRIDCGSDSSDYLYDRNREWGGDIICSKHLILRDDNHSMAARASSGSKFGQPYITARLSYSEFTYDFSGLTVGPKFVRLFFYPYWYPGFDRHNSMFTVTCGEHGQYTLLRDFNASLTADVTPDHNSMGTISREYIINVEGIFSLTFTPSTSNPDSYAFVNGIEVVSMPFDLYYSTSNGPGFQILGSTTSFNIDNNTAMEAVYRIRVGGNAIAAINDTGMLRRWDGNDADYLTASSPKCELPYFHGTSLNFTVTPYYIAPEDLYRTSRDMGPIADLSKNSNLTWEFSVDSGFTYFLRLHFCELDPNIIPTVDRMFSIYIAQQMAEDYASVLQWTDGQKGVPVYRDYAVIVPGNPGRTNLSLQLQPFSDPAYSDPFLNGLEIFKIIEGTTGNLAGINPDRSQIQVSPTPPVENSKNHSRRTKAGAVAGAVSSIVVLSFVAFMVLRLLKKMNSKCSTNAVSLSLSSYPCRQFTLTQMRKATNGFHRNSIAGVGGFGNVYKGYIDGGSTPTPVAIKRLKPGSRQGAHEFMTEIKMLSQLRHLHLVSLIGYCSDNNEMILVYDFMPRGTLRDHLYKTDNPPLSWNQRLQICIGAARGLCYLHTGTKDNIIHRDVKATNILLDDKWVAKVSDFGLSKIGPTGVSETHVTTAVKGSVGYLDPEYYRRHRLTYKSDVYSFGVVLFEVLCARPALIPTAEENEVLLSNWAKYCSDNGTLDQIVDPVLRGNIAPDCLKMFCETALSCLQEDGKQRPSMNDVVRMLEVALDLQETAEKEEPLTAIGMNGHVSTTRMEDSVATCSFTTLEPL